MKVPASIRSCLWSWDPAMMDKHRDASLIITQVLNFGGWADVQWLMKTYPRSTIREVVANPRRGVWLADVLRFWTTMLKVRLSPRRFHHSLRHIDPIA